MAKAQEEQVLRPSVLDRVCGAHGAQGPVGSVGLRELKQAVTRDLHWLLNTRQWWPTELDVLEETPRSIITYGIPDLSVFSWISHSDRKEICSCIEEAIRTFEPRLIRRTVRASLVENENKAADDFRVRLRIDAVLHVDPYTEPVSFDTDIEVDTGAIEVKGAA